MVTVITARCHGESETTELEDWVLIDAKRLGPGVAFVQATALPVT